MVKVLMTDDGKHCNYYLQLIYMLSSYIDDVYCSAARKVFGEGVRHLLCRWHVEK